MLPSLLNQVEIKLLFSRLVNPAFSEARLPEHALPFSVSWSGVLTMVEGAPWLEGGLRKLI